MRIKKYDFILPIGEACFTAETLSFLNYRTMSGPFDWMYGATFEERFRILINKFEKFFNKEDFVYQGLDPSGKDTYTNIRTGISFNHDFPHNIPFEISYPKIAEKYNKRIKRTLNKIRKAKKVLILYIDLPDSNRKLQDENKLPQLLEELRESYSNNNIDIFYLKHDENLKNNEVIYKELSENITVAACYNHSTAQNAESWHPNRENTLKALQYIQLKHYKWNKLKIKLLKKTGKIKK